MTNEDFLTANEVAKLLRMTRSNIYRLVRSGELPCTHIGSGQRPAVRFSRESLNQWIDGNSNKVD